MDLVFMLWNWTDLLGTLYIERLDNAKWASYSAVQDGQRLSSWAFALGRVKCIDENRSMGAVLRVSYSRLRTPPNDGVRVRFNLQRSIGLDEHGAGWVKMTPWIQVTPLQPDFYAESGSTTTVQVMGIDQYCANLRIGHSALQSGRVTRREQADKPRV